MARQRRSKHKQILESQMSVQNPKGFQEQLQSLLNQQKYSHALKAIEKIRLSQPDITFTPTEAEIWLLRGQQEFQKADYKSAENSLHQALKLGLGGETHYWLAKCLLERNRLDSALELLQSAFDQESLPKDYSICYAKLLLLKGDTETVAQLLKQKSKRFTAAQRHWLGGVLALKAEQPETALEAFGKVKGTITPGDCLDIWQVYTLQCLGDWEKAASKLGLSLEKPHGFRFSSKPPKYTEHPYLQRLALLQKLKTGQPPLEQMRFDAGDLWLKEIVDVLSLIEFLEEDNPHEAGHALLNLDSSGKRFPELATLRPTLLTLAGQQSFEQGEMECAELFWKPLLAKQPFNPQLAVNMIEVLGENESYREKRLLLIRLLKWLENESKQNSQDWTEEKLNFTLAHIRCQLADTWIALNRYRAAAGEIKQAERICPQSPEVVGRLGLMAFIEDRPVEATELLTQALEGGCRKEDVYDVLLEAWEELDNPEAVQKVRRRFGHHFGDRQSEEVKVEVPPWIDALSTQNYLLFSRLVQEENKAEPALRACQIFVEAVRGEPNSGGNVSLNQTKSTQAWDTLLQGLSPSQQVSTLQAIAISILLFAKREKGIAGVTTKYVNQLWELGTQEAREAHLVVLSLKERNTKKLEFPLRFYLDTMPQPGNALAEIQLKLRRFSQNIVQGQILKSFIERALEREPQNPLLLLAKATTYPVFHPNYEEFKQQGFELARRIQDARALQAFREEQAFLHAQEMQDFLPNPTDFDNLDPADFMDDLLEKLVYKIFGSQIPPSELKRMLPELKQKLRDSMPDFDYEDEDEDEAAFGFSFSFGGGASKSKKSKKRRR